MRLKNCSEAKIADLKVHTLLKFIMAVEKSQVDDPQEKYQRSRLDNAINTAILAWTAPICVTWTASKYAKNAWRWFTQHPGI